MNSLVAVFTHEWRRSLTAGRIVWWILMCLFPIAVAMMIRMRAGAEFEPRQQRFRPEMRLNGERLQNPSDNLAVMEAEDKQRRQIRDNLWTVFLYVMIPSLSSALGVLLTAGPAIATELEQRSWVYLATRPNGIIWLLLGKFLVAFTWGYSAALVALTGSVAVINVTSSFAVWWPMVLLSGLSCMAYSAVFLLVGAIFPKRAMVFSVMYATLVEVVLGIIPAVINRLTVQYRLRSLMMRWLPFDESIRSDDSLDYVIGNDAAWVHVVWLVGLTLLYFVVAQIIVHFREFTTASEGDL